MIYVDTSVVLAHVLSEDRVPPTALWDEPLITSRLTQYETWCRLHARHLTASHGDAARETLGRLAIVEMSPIVLERALEPFPVAVRTLDALHLATLAFLAARRQRPKLATFDTRLGGAASALGIDLYAV